MRHGLIAINSRHAGNSELLSTLAHITEINGALVFTPNPIAMLSRSAGPSSCDLLRMPANKSPTRSSRRNTFGNGPAFNHELGTIT
jgi:hypothetical protein